jgi:hypothetical protein
MALPYSVNTITSVPNAGIPVDDGHPLPVQVVSGGAAALADFAKVRSANSTDATFAARPPTVTQPAGDGVIAWAGKDSLLLLTYGAGADNSTVDVRVLGWQQIAGLWVPAFLCQATFTLSAIVGVAGQAVLNTERFADTVSITNGIGVGGTPVGDSAPATLEVPVGPYDLVEVLFDLGTATSANCLYSAF